MEIRHLSANDSLYDVGKVYEQSWKFAYKGIIPQSYLDGIAAGQWVQNIEKNGMCNLVAVEGGHIVGTSGFCKSRWEHYGKYGEIVSVYLLPEYMGKGYGSALLSRAAEELKKLGFQDILLWVLEGNTRAKRFYEKHGFSPTEEYMTCNIGGKELREQMYVSNTQSSRNGS